MTEKNSLNEPPVGQEENNVLLNKTNQNPNTSTKAEFDLHSIDNLSFKEKQELIESKVKKLQNFTIRNLNPKHINRSVYHLLLNPFTLDNAYKNLSRNKGAFTIGVNTGSIQGYSRNDSIKLSELLRKKKYKPNPVRRIWIPKPGKKEKRPLGIPTFYDKVVQEAVRSILESIYEPEFVEFSTKTKTCNNFGFRPNKNCWDAIDHFRTYGQKISYVIEGDIKGAYDCVNHEILQKILSRRIKDKNFLNLINKLLKAGIMDEGNYEHSILGVPQGGIVSPLLFNIYMFEFDKFIHEEIIQPLSTHTPTSNKSNLYQRILYRKKVAAKTYFDEETAQRKKLKPTNKPLLRTLKRKFHEIETLLFKTPSYDTKDTTFVYTRYADDWILGIGGSQSFTEGLKVKIESWLSQNLKLTLSPNKTKITNIRKEFVPFLGYEILLRTDFRRLKVSRVPNPNIKTQNKANQNLSLRRTTSRKFFVRPNKDRIFSKLKNLGIIRKKDLYPIGKRPWSSLNEFQIVQKYHSMYLGLLAHYVKCDTLVPLNRVSYILQYSCAKTIATRKKITMSQVFTRYGNNLEITIHYPEKSTTRKTQFMGYKKIMDTYFSGKEGRPLSVYYDPFKIRTFWRTTFKLYSICCICGCSENIEMHHVRSIKSIKQRNKDKQDFNLILQQLNRKQIPVCHECHVSITNGKYNGMKLTQLYSQALAGL